MQQLCLEHGHMHCDALRRLQHQTKLGNLLLANHRERCSKGFWEETQGDGGPAEQIGEMSQWAVELVKVSTAPSLPPSLTRTDLSCLLSC